MQLTMISKKIIKKLMKITNNNLKNKIKIRK